MKRIQDRRFLDNYQEVYIRSANYFDPLVKGIFSSPSKKPFKILDVGCGYGNFLKSCRKRFPKSLLFGLTLSKREFCSLRQTTSIHSKLGNQKDLSELFKDDRFDVIANFHTLSYITQKDQFSVIDQMTNRLSKDGILILGLIDHWFRITDKVYQSGEGYIQFYYSPFIFLKLIKQFKLTDSFIEPMNGYRIQVWQKNTSFSFPLKETTIFLQYLAKSLPLT